MNPKRMYRMLRMNGNLQPGFLVKMMSILKLKPQRTFLEAYSFLMMPSKKQKNLLNYKINSVHNKITTPIGSNDHNYNFQFFINSFKLFSHNDPYIISLK